MQTEEKIRELHAQLTDIKTRELNCVLVNRELKQDVRQRDNIIQSLKANEERIEKQVDLIYEEKRVVLAELSAKKLALRQKEHQVDQLNSKIRSLTTDLTELKESKHETDVQVSMLNTELQTYNTIMAQKESIISELKRVNKILTAQLDDKTQRYRETLEHENAVVQLKQSLDNYLVQKNNFLQNLWYCEDCHSSQQKLEELERIRRDYNQMELENRELKEQLVRCTEENKHLKRKIMKEEADYVKHQMEIELWKKTQDNLYHQVLTNSNPVSQKRPREFAERSQYEPNIPVRDLADDRPSQKREKSCHRCRADTTETTSQSQSSVFRTVTTVAEIHPEPGKSNSHSKKPRLANQKETVSKESADRVVERSALPFSTPTRFREFRNLSADKVSTPSVSSNRVPQTAVNNHVNAADHIVKEDPDTGHGNHMPHHTTSEGERTIIVGSPIVIDLSDINDLAAGTENAVDTTESRENNSSESSDGGCSLLKPLGKYKIVQKNLNASQNQTSKREQTK